MLSKQQKQNRIKKTQLHDNDTGSAEAQLSLLTGKIEELTNHLKSHPKDYHSRRGLLKMVDQRKSFLNYLRRDKKENCQKIIQELNI